MHRTVTRFFTSRGNLDRMLIMHLIGMPPSVFRLVSTQPREENKKRLNLVQGFVKHLEAPHELRRASLVLQITGGVEALTAKHATSTGEPVMVSLVKGAAQDIVVTRLRRILGAMNLDQALEPGAAACVLLLADSELIVRFGVFFLYPFKIAHLCRAWFPNTWCRQVYACVNEKERNLDVGVGLQLQRLAWAKGCDRQALGWLSSAPVQGFIYQLCEEALATSLPVERRLGEVKQWETSRSTNIATASRNMLVVRYAKQRERLAQVLRQRCGSCAERRKQRWGPWLFKQIRRCAHSVSALRTARHQRSLFTRRTVIAHGYRVDRTWQRRRRRRARRAQRQNISLCARRTDTAHGQRTDRTWQREERRC